MTRFPLWLAVVCLGCGSSATAPDAPASVPGTEQLARNVFGRDFVSAGPLTFFIGADARGREVWRTDGTPSGTSITLDIAPGLATSEPQGLAAHGNLVLFGATTPEHGFELWRSDGTAAGTSLVRDINPGPGLSRPSRGNSFPDHIVSAGSFVAFRACDEEHGPELWRTDGTPGGTRLIADIYPGPGERRDSICLENPGPRDLVVLDGIVYFIAKHPDFGTELWRSDGTEAGTWLVAEAFPGPDRPSVPPGGGGTGISGLVATGDRLFFYGPGGLWTSDGTADGTRFVAQFGGLLTGARSRVFGGDQAGLWVSNGTQAGTRVVHPVNLATSIRFENRVSSLTAIGDRVYFDGREGGAGYEPWHSDGTTAGTFQLADVDPGSGDSNPRGFLALAGRVYFIADGADGVPRLFETAPTVRGAGELRDDRWMGVDAIGVAGGRLLVSAATGLWTAPAAR
jgi:ELWxxDGT repeat protein